MKRRERVEMDRGNQAVTIGISDWGGLLGVGVVGQAVVWPAEATLSGWLGFTLNGLDGSQPGLLLVCLPDDWVDVARDWAGDFAVDGAPGIFIPTLLASLLALVVLVCQRSLGGFVFFDAPTNAIALGQSFDQTANKGKIGGTGRAKKCSKIMKKAKIISAASRLKDAKLGDRYRVFYFLGEFRKLRGEKWGIVVDLTCDRKGGGCFVYG